MVEGMCSYCFFTRAGSFCRDAYGSPVPRTPTVVVFLDTNVFKTRIQPMFTAKREGLVRCSAVSYPRTGTGGFALQPPPGVDDLDGGTVAPELRGRLGRLVAPAIPMASRLLMHPLSPGLAGGDPFHGGGKHWASQEGAGVAGVLADWVRAAGGASARTTATASSSGLSFEMYRSRVEPTPVLKPRAANKRQRSGVRELPHFGSVTRMRLQPLAPGASAWTEK